MQFEQKHDFDKPAATVMTMYADRRFFERKYAAVGGWDIQVLEHELTPQRFRIKCRYTTRNETAMPDFAKKLMGAETMITQEDVWDIAKRAGRLQIEIKGVPAKISAEMRLVEEGKGGVNRMQWSVSCGVPLIGGKLEKVIAEDINRRSAADLAASRKILADY
jgi:hypothetical protein